MGDRVQHRPAAPVPEDGHPSSAVHRISAGGGALDLHSCARAPAPGLRLGLAAGHHQRGGVRVVAAGQYRQALGRATLRRSCRRGPAEVLGRRAIGQNRSPQQHRGGTKQEGLPHPRTGLTTNTSVKDQPKQIGHPSTEVRQPANALPPRLMGRASPPSSVAARRGPLMHWRCVVILGGTP